MNENHARLCSSPEWSDLIRTELLPSLVGNIDLGDDMLEVGPEPGAATGWLCRRVRRLVALEIDSAAAGRLATGHGAANLEVVVGDASAMQFPDACFDSVGSFAMLHHVPTAAAQYKVLSEMFRVLRPGGVLVASDSLANDELHHFHVDDTYNPMEPATLLVLLKTLGFPAITLLVDQSLGVVARKPPSPEDPQAA